MQTATSCAFCGRPLGARTEAHHLTPKRYGGKETALLHPICHRKIHTRFSERELRDSLSTMDVLRRHPDIRTFIAWIEKKDPDFYVATQDAKQRR